MAQAKQQIVKYQKGKHSFKVVCNPGTVLQYREGKLGISKVLQIDIVFTNVTRGDRASNDDLKAVFGENTTEQQILTKIIEEGEIEYSANERKKFMDDKTNEIIYYIHKNWIDPKTKLPHPIDRIKNAISSSKKKVQIDLKQDSKKQAQDIVKKLQGTLMFAKAAIFACQLTIKYTYDGKCKNLIHGIASNVKEDYTGEGCVYTIELTKSDMDALEGALSKPTGGDYSLIMLDQQQQSGSSGLNGNENESKNNGNDGKKGKKKKKASSKHGKRGQEMAVKKDKQQQQHQESSQSQSETMSSVGNSGTDGKGNKKSKKSKKHKGNASGEASQSSQSSQNTMASEASQSGKGKKRKKGKKDKNIQ